MLFGAIGTSSIFVKRSGVFVSTGLVIRCTPLVEHFLVLVLQGPNASQSVPERHHTFSGWEAANI